jgi:hypothetical protein
MTVAKARSAKIKVCATDGSYNEPLDYVINKASGWRAPQQMSTTHMGDVADRSESSGFYNSTLDVTFHRNAADTTGQTIVFANNPCWVQYAEDGSTFLKAQMSWEETSNHAAGADKQTVSVTFKLAGGAAPVAA